VDIGSEVNSTIVHVRLAERSYEIHIGVGNLAQLPDLLRTCGKVTQAVVVTDSNVQSPHAEQVLADLQRAGIGADLRVVPAGEVSKSVENAHWLWRELVRLRADRRTFVVAVGGGMVGDLAGFVAATFARGVPLFQVPTSLLAQVDSSVGGKVAVNLPEAKNMVGAFYQPRGVLIDVATLKTLPDREYRSGLAEVVKYGVILDCDFFAYLENHVLGLLAREPLTLRDVVARCCRLKADIVEQDEREETGLRAVLNYGHTFGHALETLGTYDEWLHGEAVAIGMMCAARLAHRVGWISEDLVIRQRQLLAALGLPVELPKLDPQQMLDAMSRDKKVVHGKLRFVLPRRLGHVELAEDVPAELVREILQGS